MCNRLIYQSWSDHVSSRLYLYMMRGGLENIVFLLFPGAYLT